LDTSKKLLLESNEEGEKELINEVYNEKIDYDASEKHNDIS
jgi:hypothetical protein